jgi:hypothetical protein
MSRQVKKAGIKIQASISWQGRAGQGKRGRQRKGRQGFRITIGIPRKAKRGRRDMEAFHRGSETTVGRQENDSQGMTGRRAIRK